MTIGTIRYVLAPEFDSCFLINSIIVKSSFCDIYIKLSYSLENNFSNFSKSSLLYS